MDGNVNERCSFSLKEASLSIMEKYGSQLIKIIKFRDSFVMIGQKGLARGKAIEMVKYLLLISALIFLLFRSINLKEIVISLLQHISVVVQNFHVCRFLLNNSLDYPCSIDLVGQITPLSFPNSDINKGDKIAVGTSIKNCGLPDMCKDNEFAVHVYTGKDNNDEPKICVDGKYVMAKGINDAGRGINIVVVSNGKEVIRTGHFDTWQEGPIVCNRFLILKNFVALLDSTNLEIFLENLEDNVILIAVTFDEASTK